MAKKKKIMRQGTAPGAKPVSSTGILIAQQTYSNIGTFLRVPASRDVAHAEHVFLGVPYDTATTFRPFTVYFTVAALYFLLCFPLTQASRRLERRLHAAR